MRNPHPPLPTICLGALVALAVLAPRAGAECPGGWFRFADGTAGPLIDLPAAAWDTTIALPYTSAHAGYDLARGVADFEVESAPLAIVHLVLADRFVVEEPVPGDPCVLRIELAFSGSLLAYGGHGSAGYASATLTAGAEPAVSAFVGTNGPGVETPFARVLALDLAVLAGEPFAVELALEGGANVGGDARAAGLATLSVTTSLPTGRIASCHGYGPAPPTASVPGTWGALKARYR